MEPYKKLLVLLIMIYLHILDDFVLQNCLAKLKQKDHWTDIVKDHPLYKYDYIMALIAHATEWTTTVSIPIFISFFIKPVDTFLKVIFLIIYVITIALHAHIDNRKANVKDINLIIDQFLHVIQTIGLWFVFCGIWN